MDATVPSRARLASLATAGCGGDPRRAGGIRFEHLDGAVTPFVRSRRRRRPASLTLCAVALALGTATGARAQEARPDFPPVMPLPGARPVETYGPDRVGAGSGRGGVANGDRSRPDEAMRPGAASVAKYFAGGAAAFGAHEAGHLLFGTVFGTSPGVRGVNFGPLPFFALTHGGNLSLREEYVVSSAGFWTQQLTSEAILSLRPGLRNERAPFLKGMLAFDVLASVAYAGAAFASAGPNERDTLGMATSLRVREPWIGALILAPALLDVWRYAHPGAAWARWLSRGFKVGEVVLVIRCSE